MSWHIFLKNSDLKCLLLRHKSVCVYLSICLTLSFCSLSNPETGIHHGRLNILLFIVQTRGGVKPTLCFYPNKFRLKGGDLLENNWCTILTLRHVASAVVLNFSTAGNWRGSMTWRICDLLAESKVATSINIPWCKMTVLPLNHCDAQVDLGYMAWCLLLYPLRACLCFIKYVDQSSTVKF